MGHKLLKIDHEKCTGCRLCELVCAVKHHQVSNPAKSRIRVVKWEAEGLYVPMACQQCQDAPCQKACPSGCIAIEGHKPEGATRRVTTLFTLNFTTCSLCGLCVESCNFEGLRFSKAYNLASQRRQDFQMDLLRQARERKRP